MKVSSNRIGAIRQHYRNRLEQKYSVQEADSLMFQLLKEYTGYSKALLLTKLHEPVSESQLLDVHFAVEELEKDKPIQYVLGRTEFYGLPFIVNSNVLIPRPETEELVEHVIKATSHIKNPSIIDIGTGSGCIAIALKKNIPKSIITAIDISEFALEVARHNATLNDVSVSFNRVDILNEETWEALGNFDVIISNPPYVRNSEKSGMKKNVLEFEPSIALFVPDDDPLVFYRYISKFAGEHLKKEGMLICEINQYLSEETRQFFLKVGFQKVQILKDIFENYRILSCIR